MLGVGGGGGMPFLSIIIRLLTLACRCLHGLSISGAALDDAEHSLADLDFRDQSVGPSPVLRPLCTTSFSFAVPSCLAPFMGFGFRVSRFGRGGFQDGFRVSGFGKCGLQVGFRVS